MGTVYLLHFSEPVGSAHPRGKAQHYLGFVAEDGHLDYRIAQHRSGNGAHLTAAAVSQGIELLLVATWPGDGKRERQFKNLKNHRKLCPLCQAARRNSQRRNAKRKNLKCHIKKKQ